MAIDNDTRGWIMTALSGIACMLGSLVICVDLLIRKIPTEKCRTFSIHDSNAFLSSSLSLSFGVMLFSSLYNMLPSSKSSLVKGGFSPKAAALTLVACFIAGAVGIQILSRILYRYIPSHVVDCHHTHEDEEAHEPPKRDHSIHSNPRHELKAHRHRPRSRSQHSLNGHISPIRARRLSWSSEHHDPQVDGQRNPHRPHLHSHFSSRVSQLVSNRKAFCDEDGQCYGYTDPCGIDCFSNLQARGGSKLQYHTVIRNSLPHRRPSHPQRLASQTERTPLLHHVHEETSLAVQSPADLSFAPDQHMPNNDPTSPRPQTPSSSRQSELLDSVEHHHHVPANAFLSIGLQTCMAIALHKLPEGFITYATNHANPRLGFSVFLALFIHNIAEGFAMALPLYLALNSKWKAVIWSSVLGGVSQPFGAAVAALWFRVAGNVSSEPGEGVYGCLFAIVAGILASVALQLFGESLDLTHNRTLCMAFAFVGMGLLGISGALTA